MTTKRLAIFALAFGIGCGMSAPGLTKDKHHHKTQPEQYIPAEGNIIDILFGGPRYYDQQLFTTGAGPCSYNPVGPDANAINKINDHHCGK